MTSEDTETLQSLETDLRVAHARALEHHIAHVGSVDDYFVSEDKGDFEWKCSEAGDWSVYRCGEKDCPQQWHTVAYAVDAGRTAGKRWVEVRSCDEEGDWDSDGSYDERTGSVPEDWPDFARWATGTHEYFHGWGLYWIDAARTGKDPCSQVLGDWRVAQGGKFATWVEFCLDAVRSNIKYLLMGTGETSARASTNEEGATA